MNHHKQTTFQQHLPTTPHHSDETEVPYTILLKEAFNTKRRRDFHPVIKGKIIVRRIEAIDQVTVHEQAVNREQQAVFLITDVADSNFILACGNPFGEPVSVG